jgi:hypothetical protein
LDALPAPNAGDRPATTTLIAASALAPRPRAARRVRVEVDVILFIQDTPHGWLLQIGVNQTSSNFFASFGEAGVAAAAAGVATPGVNSPQPPSALTVLPANAQVPDVPEDGV